ncbi:MAG: 16S rRNA (uracil(1498)-N(3))-methyltransferase [Bacillota bacterium]|nr:16S rRNA (uracil(1498)-N(3))-methyltransferase [Bacillota bacterium]
MNTYFISQEDVEAEDILIKGELFHHLSRVLRIKTGDKLHFSDNNIHTYDGEVVEITKESIKVNIENIAGITGEPPLDVYLIQCLPRGDKMEQIIQKCTELGVGRLIAAESDNSQVRLKNKAKEKEERYSKIAAAAAEQCGRGKIPQVMTASSLDKALAYLSPDTKIIFCYEKEVRNSLKTELQKTENRSIALVIGPEGGFSSREAQLIMASGGVAVTMGPRILRTETAGPCGLAALMYEKGDWGSIVEN